MAIKLLIALLDYHLTGPAIAILLVLILSFFIRLTIAIAEDKYEGR